MTRYDKYASVLFKVYKNTVLVLFAVCLVTQAVAPVPLLPAVFMVITIFLFGGYAWTMVYFLVRSRNEEKNRVYIEQQHG